MKILAIIQARMGSTRLPGKMMLTVLGKPIIQWVVERVKSAKLIDGIILATSTNDDDDVLFKWALDHAVPCFRGSNNDVLDRYYQAARLTQADAIVRITGDCPLMDSQIIDRIVAKYQSNGYDYVTNSQPPTYPDGLDVEIFSFTALEKAWKEAGLASEREHVTAYIWKHPEFFKIANVKHVTDLSEQRWTLDMLEDFELIKYVIEDVETHHSGFTLDNILRVIKSHPKWQKINIKYKRNEGYAKSIMYDAK